MGQAALGRHAEGPRWTTLAGGLPRAVAVLLLVLYAGLGTARAEEPDPLHDAWRWSNFGVDSGLPHDRVHEVVETRDRPWCATHGGLAWFDGWRWNPVGPEAGLPAEAPDDLVPLPDGRLAVVVRGRLHAGGETGFRELRATAGGTPLWVHDAAPLGSGNLLLLASETRFGQLALFVVPDRGGAAAPVGDVAPGLRGVPERVWSGRSGRAWVSTDAGLYVRADDRWERRVGGDALHRTGAVAEDGHGRALAAVQLPIELRGLWSWDAGGEPRREPALALAAAMDVTPRGDVVVVESSGEVHVRRDGAWSRLRPAPEELTAVLCVTAREDGGLWVGTEHGLHLYRAGLRRWSTLRYGSGDARDSVNDVLQASDGTLWMATSGGLVARRPGGSEESIREAAGVALVDVTGVAEDAQGRIFAVSGSTFAGAVCLEDGRWSRVGAAEGLLAAQVHRIARDRGGRLWFLGLRGLEEERGGPGAYVLQDGRFTRWSVAEGLPDGHVYAFSEGPDGAYWFGTRAGISRHRAGVWTHFGTDEGLPSPKVFSLCAADDGRVWFALQETGLGYVDAQDRVHRMTAADGLPSEQVWEVRTDERGFVWASSWGGIWLWRDGRGVTLGTRTGMPSLRCWPVLPLADRVLLGSSGGGLHVLDLAELDEPPPRVRFGTAAVDRSRVVLSWSAASHWAALEPADVRTRWRLDAGQWSPWSRVHTLDLDGLEPGPHEIRVQALGLFGGVSESDATARFEVLAPLVRRPEFVIPISLLALACGALLAHLAARRRHHLEALRRTEERRRRLFEDDLAGAFVAAPDGRFVECNPSFARIFGFESPQAAAGARVGLVWPDRAARRALLERLAQEGRLERQELELRRLDGTRVDVVANLVALRGEDGSLEHVLGYVFDDTQRRRLAARLLQNRKLEAVGRLAGGIAHDFNNLLTVIGGYAQMLLASLPEKDARRAHAREIRQAAERAAGLTARLLAFGRGQALQPIPTDLNGLLRTMEPTVRSDAGPGVEVRFELAPDLPPSELDPAQMDQVVMQLVRNAREAMPEGGVLRIATSRASVPSGGNDELTGAPEGEYVRLSVIDSGVGMDAETRVHVFEPFFSTKRGDGATGLGLATVYGIVRQGRGHVGFSSEPGQGTRFDLLFPAARVLPAAAGPDAPEASGAEDAAPATILLLEDEEAVRELLVAVLGDAGFRVISAADGREALRVAAGHPGTIELIVSDVVMPGMTGPEAVRRLVSDRPGTPALFVSGYTGGAIGRHGLVPADTPFLQKPFTPEDLVRKVRELLATR